MDINRNYSIGEVFQMLEQDTPSSEILYLKEIITKYKEETTIAIQMFAEQIPQGTRGEAMTWVVENVPDPLQYYVKCEYLGEAYDVLKKKGDKWRTVADIGVAVVQDPTESYENQKIWLAEFNKAADEMSATGLIFYESHAHYDLDVFRERRSEIMKKLHQSGVEKCVIPGILYLDSKKCMEIFDSPEYDWVFYTVGSHPKYIWKEKDAWTEERWQEFRKLLTHSKCCGVGEVGLDYSYGECDEAHRSFQKEMFVRFIEEANQAQLPVVLHIRPAEDSGDIYDVHADALQVLKEHPIRNGAVLHCFGGDINLLQDYRNVGVQYFGIGGRITYSMEDLHEAVKQMPVEGILLETDSPFIGLENHRKPNTSCSLHRIAESIAKLRGEEMEYIATEAKKNFMRFYCL